MSHTGLDRTCNAGVAHRWGLVGFGGLFPTSDTCGADICQRKSTMKSHTHGSTVLPDLRSEEDCDSRSRMNCAVLVKFRGELRG
jgi:hypothetical protein